MTVTTFDYETDLSLTTATCGGVRLTLSVLIFEKITYKHVRTALIISETLGIGTYIADTERSAREEIHITITLTHKQRFPPHPAPPQQYQQRSGIQS